MDPQHIAAFSTVRTSEYLTLDDNCQKLKKFIADYEAVKSALTSLSDKCKHPVMVPFGNVAFMTGSLVHTNDVLMLLGDNWFVEQSAKQTVDILSRRMTALQTEVDQLQARMQQIKTELSYAKELGVEGSDTVEIVEPYDEHFEQNWKAQHEASLHKYLQETKESNTLNRNDQTSTDSIEYEQIWRRLEQLEKEEAEGKEDEDKGEICPDAETAEQQPLSCTSSDSENIREDGQTLVINFKHSVTGFQIRERFAAVCSPADIYDRFCVPCDSTTSCVGATDLDNLRKIQDVSSETTVSWLDAASDVAVSDDLEMQQSAVATDTSETSIRKVSKFKASRLKK